MSVSGLLAGKKGLIMGVANERSIAYGVAQEAFKHGASLAFSYQGEVLKKRVEPLADALGSKTIIECDVAQDDSIDRMFDRLSNEFNGELDFVVHSIAFANKQELRGRFSQTSRAGFALAMDISCYSFIAIAERAAKMMKSGGSIISMTYFGAEKVVANYNVMGVAKAALEASTRYLAADLGNFGIRVNSVSPGPIKTLAAAGIGDFGKMMSKHSSIAPLGRNVSQEEVGKVSVFLLSDLASAVTGENIYVDCGFNIIGVPNSTEESE